MLSVIAASTYLVALGPARPARAQDHDSHGWEEAWRIELSRGVAASPTWADSLLFIASLDRNLHAVVPGPKPRIAWRRSFKGGFDAAPVLLGDQLILAELGAEGRLLAVTRSTRTETWSIRLGDLVAQPVASGDRIYAATTAGRVAAVSSRGVELWRTELKARVVARPVVLAGALLVASAEGALFALDPGTGLVRERVDPEAGPIWGDPAVLESGERGPLAVYATLEGQLLAVTADLEIVARRSLPSRFYAGPHLAEGDLVLAGHEGTVWAYAWEPAEIRWRRELPGTLRAGPAVGQRAVAVGDLGGGLYLLDRETGELRWHARLDGAITAAPLLAGREMYVATEQGTLYAFRPTTPASR